MGSGEWGALEFRSSMVDCWVLNVCVFACSSISYFHISSFTLYGVTNLVTEVTKIVTHEESLTMAHQH